MELKDRYLTLLIDTMWLQSLVTRVKQYPMPFKKIPADHNNSDYLYPDNEINKKHAKLWSDFQNGQVQYICNKVMIIARRLDVQYQQYNKPFVKYFWRKYRFYYWS